jgi:nicotinamide-nucleotide amidase
MGKGGSIMHAELISVGTELLLGDILNTNVQYLSRELAALGIDVFYQSSVGDNKERLKETVAAAINRSNIIILTGGLGPTQDDITVESVAELVGLPLLEDKNALNLIEKYFSKTERVMTDNNRKQALIPQGAEVFYNNHGTAPGCAIATGDQAIIMLPGVPWEMKAMFEESVKKYLRKYSEGSIYSAFVHVYGIGESAVSEMLDDMIAFENPTVAPYAKDGEMWFRVSAKSDSEDKAKALCESAVEQIRERLGSYVYAINENGLERAVFKLLKEQGKTVATAESCTGGLISKRLTDIPGASMIFSFGAVTYSDEVKEKLLGVPEFLINKYTAVSKEVAAKMAQCALYKSGADYAVSITGYAGDDGGDNSGTAFIGICDKDRTYVIKAKAATRSGREYVRTCFSSSALNALRLCLEGYELSQIDYLDVVLCESTPEEEKHNHDIQKKKFIVISEPKRPSAIIPPMSAIMGKGNHENEIIEILPEVNISDLPEVDKKAIADSLDTIL